MCTDDGDRPGLQAGPPVAKKDVLGTVGETEGSGTPKELPPPPPPPRRRGARITLNSASAIARELARVYRDARTGRLPTTDATKLAHVLDVLRRCLETSDLEQRLSAVEASLAGKGAM